MKLYENVVIGNFLFALGFAMRAQQPSGKTVSVVNLLQQTPADTQLGDLLLRFPGVMRLIEFKAEGNRSSKESVRHTVLMNALKDEPLLKEVSREVHWFVEVSAPKDSDVVAHAVPYLDAFPRGAKKLGSFEGLIHGLAEDAARGASAETEEAQAAYLQWFKMLQGDGVIGTGGLLLVADTDGSMHYAQLMDFLELRMEHRQWVEFHEKRLQRELTHQRKVALELTRDRGYER